MSLYGAVCEPCPLQVRVQDGYNLNKKRSLYLLFSHACDQTVGIGVARSFFHFPFFSSLFSFHSETYLLVQYLIMFMRIHTMEMFGNSRRKVHTK